MKIKNLFYFLCITILSLSFTACSDDDKDNDVMVWEVVSNSNPTDIEVVNNATSNSGSIPSILVKANYKGGDIVLKCKNHPIAFSLIGPNDSYTNPECKFTISRVDDNSLSISFEEDASGRNECSDQITITNADQKKVVCNTLLYITRTLGDLQ